MRAALVVVVALLLASASATVDQDPQPVWPPTFSANISMVIQANLEPFLVGGNGSYSFQCTSDGCQSLQVVPSHSDIICAVAKNNSETCFNLATLETRYYYWPESQACCQCCTVAEGCGSLIPAWVENGTVSETCRAFVVVVVGM